MFCRNCGSENDDTNKFCRNCGQALGTEHAQQEETIGSAQSTTQSEPEPTPVQYSSYQTFQTESPIDTSKPSGMSIAALVLGIVSIVCCCLHIISIACGIVAIVLAKKEDQRGMGNGFTKAGFICGLIGAILGGIYLIYWIIAVVMRGVAANGRINRYF